MLKKVIDPLLIETYVAAQLTNVTTWINVDSRLNLNQSQIPLVAQLLTDKYITETVEDISLCLRLGSIGAYGSVYRIDAAVICDWMSKYLDDKYQLIESGIAKEKRDREPDFPISPEVRKIIEGFKQSLNKIWVPSEETLKMYEHQIKWMNIYFDEEGNRLPDWIEFDEYYSLQK